MSKLYASPLRVYLLLFALALAGIYSGLKLPISLFPNSNKPEVWIQIPYGGSSAQDFLRNHGANIEEELRSISTDKVKVEKVLATYREERVNIDVMFEWGSDSQDAEREARNTVNTYAARLPPESRNNIGVWINDESNGFLAVSFFSETRSLEDVYKLVEPQLTPRLARVKEAASPYLYNPQGKEVRILLKPDAMASLQIFPRDIERAVVGALGSRTAGSFSSGPNQFNIEVTNPVTTIAQLEKLPIVTSGGSVVTLTDIATVDFATTLENARSFKTSGAPSIILFASPKPGGNVKRMAEESLAEIRAVMETMPKDIHYKVLVDPSEFIRAAVNNVFHEVGIGAFLAVCVLFLFIGSFKNVATAAIEIPLSLIMAFIFMKVFNMNLNLISLGGLALSAGMNVDASVVVMENIFRHFDSHKGPKDFATRLKIITDAVAEVRFAVISSTIASLVVFLPLTFTSALSNAILGDLAKAVVFSHGLSAFVALLLVPTVRLQLMNFEKASAPHKSPIEGFLKALENGYSKLLGIFIERRVIKLTAYVLVAVVLFALAATVIPRLPKEVVGTPDTDWVMLHMNTDSNTRLQQMELQAEQIERDVLEAFESKIAYTFNQIRRPNRATLMTRLKDKRDMTEIMKAFEQKFTDTPTMRFSVEKYNPSELNIPDPPHMRIAVRGGEIADKVFVAQQLSDILKTKEVFPRIWSEPGLEREQGVKLVPSPEQWVMLRSAKFGLGDIADLLKVTTNGRWIADLDVDGRSRGVYLRYPQSYIGSVEDVAAFPIGVGSKVVPLKAITNVEVKTSNPKIYRENGRSLFLIYGQHKMGEENKKSASLLEAEKLVAEWEKTANKKDVTVTFEDADKDLSEAIEQLGYAVAFSILLIFITLVLQFGSFVEPLLVLVAIPSGFIGVLVSLFVFKSTLSLNSVLGVILLNGIAVANSIILVDFIKRLVSSGVSPRQAAIDAAKKRLRPILITSLTTVLGMLPIALGFGEGGKVLQPLGIAVSGGLWISMLLTLFLVPALQVSYLEWRNKSSKRESSLEVKKVASTILGIIVTFFSVISLTEKAAAAASNASENFNETLQALVHQNSDVKAQRIRYEEARARNLPNTYRYFPALSANAGIAAGKTGESDFSRNASLGAEVKVNLFRFGADKAAIGAGNADVERHRLLLIESELRAEQAGVTLLIAYLKAKKEFEILSRVEKLERDSYRLSQERYKRGFLPLQEVEKLNIDLANAEARLHEAEVTMKKAMFAVESVLGSEPTLADWPWRTDLSQASLPVLTEELLLSRPDLLAARENIVTNQLRSKEARAQLYPSLDASAGYKRRYFFSNGQATTLPELGGALTLSIPVFERFVTYSESERLVYAERAARLDAERLERDARLKARSAQVEFQSAVRAAVASEKVLEQARKMFQENQTRFQKGVLSVNDLSVDQNRFYNSELNSLRSWSSAHVSYAEYCAAYGLKLSDCFKRGQ